MIANTNEELSDYIRSSGLNEILSIIIGQIKIDKPKNTVDYLIKTLQKQ